ncbi:hypothetical protein GCM10009802_36510 [Streptomyces synnematoformans]|uniref:Uncharacterized protein n=1 Tax=Streptomyces synnematoformans TaxID=415721 RepID=A0ABN2YKL4_9ACTN
MSLPEPEPSRLSVVGLLRRESVVEGPEADNLHASQLPGIGMAHHSFFHRCLWRRLILARLGTQPINVGKGGEPWFETYGHMALHARDVYVCKALPRGGHPRRSPRRFTGTALCPCYVPTAWPGD